ncbi:Nonribosomal peptide synthetase 10 [Penicillium rolfsii]|nr:Nonribosomal peptide synthetase 10 [Penicillium rolfsii]
MSESYHEIEKEIPEDILPDPFCGSLAKEMIFRSGNLGFWDEQGNLHCCGRNDRQVKMQGFRIHLDDITTVVLQKMPPVRKSIAIAENGVVGVCVEPKEIDTELPKRKLPQALPPHAVPQNVRPERLPQMRYGKVDTKTLASHTPTCPTSRSNEALTLVEKTIAGERRRLLALDKTLDISRFDDFPALGVYPAVL